MLLFPGKIERKKDISCGLSSAQGFFAVLATTAILTGGGLIRFFLTTLTKSPSEGFSSSQWTTQVENS
jgi:hypothetical protein